MDGKMPNQQVMDFFAGFPKEDPFLEELGAYVVSIRAGEIKLGLKITPRQANVHGIAHGGVATTLLDTAMGGSCFSLGKSVVSLNCSLNFLSAVPLGHEIVAAGRVVHDGKHTMVTEGEVTDKETGRLYMKGTATFYVLECV